MSNRNTFYSGYLFTRESLRRIVEMGFNQNLFSTFKMGGFLDDLILGNVIQMQHIIDLIFNFIDSGRCLDVLNVTFVDDRDQDGRHRFLHYPVEKLFDNASVELHYTSLFDCNPHGPVN